MHPPAEVTELLNSYSNGDESALERLLPAVYRELRRLAGAMMRGECDGHTLQPTALVHEAYFRLVDQNDVRWENRAHFFALAAQMMRRVLVDHARKKRAEKRGGSRLRVVFDEAALPVRSSERDPDVIALDDALTRLTALDPRQARVVELRCFAGLDIDETARVLGISPATVKRDWAIARAWLHKELSRDGS